MKIYHSECGSETIDISGPFTRNPSVKCLGCNEVIPLKIGFDEGHLQKIHDKPVAWCNIEGLHGHCPEVD